MLGTLAVRSELFEAGNVSVLSLEEGAAVIMKTRGVLGGKARIAGTRIAVSHMVALVKLGYTVEEVLREYPQLTREQVEAALKYYEEHRDEIDRELEDELVWRVGRRYSEALLKKVELERELCEELGRVPA